MNDLNIDFHMLADNGNATIINHNIKRYIDRVTDDVAAKAHIIIFQTHNGAHRIEIGWHVCTDYSRKLLATNHDIGSNDSPSNY